MDSDKATLWFNVGPVQGFVGEARRTRDLWTGSWVLSNLTEHAIAAVEKAGGDILIPYRDRDSQCIVTSDSKYIGCNPNWFTAEFTSRETAVTAAKSAMDAFQKRWFAMADTVWQDYVKQVESYGQGTREIWERQIDNFWEISWTVTSGEASGVDRKLIRNFPATVENGTKCSLMGEYQEISGHYGRGGWAKQGQFWEQLRNAVGGYELRDGERLCSIALVKRLFPKKEVGEKSSWPSTSFIAALPWLQRAAQADCTALQTYSQEASKAGYKHTETVSAKHCGLPQWAGIDGKAWFPEHIDYGAAELEDNSHLAKLLKEMLEKKLSDSRKPVPFYALLAMDGDSIGNLLKTTSSKNLSRLIHQFSSQVEGILRKHSGFAIYAGGDDILAFLPAERALKASLELNECFRETFRTEGISATISGSILYAHIGQVLRKVIKTGHSLLEDIAKERSGRDSLAIGVLLGSGLNLVWSSPWSVVQGEEDGTARLEEIIDEFGLDEKENAKFNSSFLYKLREQFTRLSDGFEISPGSFMEYEANAKEDIFRDIAHSEYRRRMTKEDRKASSLEATEKFIIPLLSLSKRWKRDKDGNSKAVIGTFGFDGWRLGRFLKQIAEGRMDDHV